MLAVSNPYELDSASQELFDNFQAALTAKQPELELDLDQDLKTLEDQI